MDDGHMDETIQCLVRRSRAGSPEAFACLATRFGPRVFALAFSLLLNADDAEEVVQESFLRAFSSLGKLRAPDKFESWMFRIACRTAMDILRARQRETVMDGTTLWHSADRSEGAIGQMTRAEADAILARALSRLPESLRVPVVLRFIDETPYPEIAESLNITRYAAEKRVERGLCLLRQHCEREGIRRADVFCSLFLTCPLAQEFYDRMTELLRNAPPPHTTPADLTPKVAGAVFAGTAALALVGAMAFPQPAQEVAPSPEGTRTMRVVLLGDVELEAVKNASVESNAGARTIVEPGAEWHGWLPSEPKFDTSVPKKQTAFYVTPPSGAEFGNDHGVLKEFASVYGVVTLDMWVKPSTKPVNMTIGMVLDGSPNTFVHKNEDNWWYVDMNPTSVPSNPTPILPVNENGDYVKVVHRTESGTFDIYLNGKRMVRNARSPHGKGRAVTGVWLNSGRGGRRATSYFDALTVRVSES